MFLCSLPSLLGSKICPFSFFLSTVRPAQGELWVGKAEWTQPAERRECPKSNGQSEKGGGRLEQGEAGLSEVLARG